MKKTWLTFVGILILASLLALCLIFSAESRINNISFGEVHINLYIINLDDVSRSYTAKITQTIEGILDASGVDRITFLADFMSSTYADLGLNISVSVIHNWTEYETLLETGSNCIVINAHGETLPIPSDYSPERWIAKIAEALAYRNVTWVHTGLYPFYYAYIQSSGESILGEDGFEQFMNYIGKNNVTCQPTPPNAEGEVKGMSEYAIDMLSFSWPIDDVRYAEFGKPLHSHDFKAEVVLPIWDAGNDVPGAVVKFARDDSNGFGFYVHIGTNVTYARNQPSLVKTADEDRARGYVGAAAALWSTAFRNASETAILDAERALAKAMEEGRTNNLDSARQYEQNATRYFNQNDYRSALISAKLAISSAETATKPESGQTPQYFLPLAVVVSAGLFGLGLLLSNKRNGKKRI